MPDETVGDKTSQVSDARHGGQDISQGSVKNDPGNPGVVPGSGASPSVSNKDRNAVKRLEKSVGMALQSDRFRVFLGQGVIPPVSEKKHFVARLKKQDRIEVAVMQGNSDKASENEFVGEIGLSNIKLRDDGRAEIEIDFTVDEKGSLIVTIFDRLSGTESMGRFVLSSGERTEVGDINMGRLPVEQLSQKIDLLEQQMQLLKGELSIRREREKI